jgi:DNA-binding LytR/AlgR family response regulator
MKNGRFEIKKTLSELEDLYKDYNFFRVSKSALVNLAKVTSVASDVDRTLLATLTGKLTIRVSRKNANEFKERVNLS